MALLSRHPALKAASAQAPIAEWFLGDDWRYSGVLFLAHAFGFCSSFGRPRAGEFQVPVPRFDCGTPDGYDFFLNTVGPMRNVDEKIFHGQIQGWQDVLTHEVCTDYRKSRNPSQYLTNIKATVMTVGGLFDAEDVYGPWQVYESIEKLNPGTTNFIVKGPWLRLQWNEDAGEYLGDIHFSEARGIEASSQDAREEGNIRMHFGFAFWLLRCVGDGGAFGCRDDRVCGHRRSSLGVRFQMMTSKAPGIRSIGGMRDPGPDFHRSPTATAPRHSSSC